MDGGLRLRRQPALEESGDVFIAQASGWEDLYTPSKIFRGSLSHDPLAFTLPERDLGTMGGTWERAWR